MLDKERGKELTNYYGMYVNIYVVKTKLDRQRRDFLFLSLLVVIVFFFIENVGKRSKFKKIQHQIELFFGIYNFVFYICIKKI